MSYKVTFQEPENLILVEFEGDISFADEVEAVRSGFENPRLRPNPLVLVDRTRSRITVGPEKLRQLIDVVVSFQARIGRPQVAITVSNDHDFGMLRMFEFNAVGEVIHVFKVFRSLDEARAWLGIPAESISGSPDSAAP